MTENNDLIMVLTTGKQDRGTRATLAFAWGCAALAMGKQVSMYLTMEGTMWALRGAMRDVEVGGFEPLSAYLEQYCALGGELLVCAPCSEYYCSFDRDTMTEKLIPEAKLVGLTTIVGKTGPSTKVITF
ncbi:MAG: DsrE family protein [Candidatus Eremiobacteraeota bacterium]|nr:DsrE family protein [Candidatus Eremiobacteraeota bacterium]